jgi:hypothetical protein
MYVYINNSLPVAKTLIAKVPFLKMIFVQQIHHYFFTTTTCPEAAAATIFFVIL